MKSFGYLAKPDSEVLKNTTLKIQSSQLKSCFENTILSVEIVSLKHDFILEAKIMFGNRFCFLFSKTCFWEYKEKQFSCIFEIKNMFG